MACQFPLELQILLELQIPLEFLQIPLELQQTPLELQQLIRLTFSNLQIITWPKVTAWS